MATTLFSDATYSVSGLVDRIERGEIALPDIQRPFGWSATKVRDLFDSMYKGFPVGYLLFWETGAEPGASQIGTDDKEPVPRLLIVDGQQRLTALFSVMTGRAIVTHDYRQTRLRIAFRPADATFAVADVAVEKDPEFIPDITALWERNNGRKRAVREFLGRLQRKRELSQDDQNQLEHIIDRVYDLRGYPFRAAEVSQDVDEELVAEIFVRINSEGVTLNQADFILTLMSVFWEKGRRELEDFCRDCLQPSTSGASPFNWYIRPQPQQLLRVGVAVAFRRAVLKRVYTLLRGKDLDTGKFDAGRREQQLARLRAAQEKTLDLTNWQEFLQCLERAGFRGAKMISSEKAILYTYALWLVGRVDYNAPLDRLREVMARWFFMAHTTSRYSGTFESRFEREVAEVGRVRPGDGDGFARIVSQMVDDGLTGDYWTITLPNDLGTSASKSPALLAYLAALNVLDTNALLSTGKVRSRLDPAIIAKKGIEWHHLFPRAYLQKRLDVRDTQQINQIANMALVEWSDNIAISDRAPEEYWPQQISAASERIPQEQLARQRYWNALPDGWERTDYQEFLEERRRMMAVVVRDAYRRLRDPGYQPVYPPTPSPPETSQSRSRTYYGVNVAQLMRASSRRAPRSPPPRTSSTPSRRSRRRGESGPATPCTPHRRPQPTR